MIKLFFLSRSVAALNYYIFLKLIYSSLVILLTFFYFFKNNIQYQFSFFLKKISIKKIKKKNYIGNLNFLSFLLYLIFFYLTFFYLTTLKLSIFIYIFILSFFFICILENSIDMISVKKTIYFDYLIPFFLSAVVVYFNDCNNILVITLLLEVCSYIFYLQFFNFLNISKKNNLIFVYTDSIISYFWNNFFSTIFLFFASMLCLILFNTLNLVEISYFSKTKKDIFLFFAFFFVGLNIKIGGAGFHFFKINIYKVFSIPAVLNFSFLALIFYFNFLILFSVISVNIYIIYLMITFIIFVYSSIFLGVELQNISNILIFLAYSTLLTTCLLIPIAIF